MMNRVPTGDLFMNVLGWKEAQIASYLREADFLELHCSI